MTNEQTIAPESTAVRVALWRAMHMQIDAPPHVFEDDIGVRLVNPDDSWRQRPDMDLEGTKLFRTSIVWPGPGSSRTSCANRWRGASGNT
jgi:O-methyltransferase involved in polyketide biosynthesis